jgi:hypothetical protein
VLNNESRIAITRVSLFVIWKNHYFFLDHSKYGYVYLKRSASEVSHYQRLVLVMYVITAEPNSVMCRTNNLVFVSVDTATDESC